MSNHGCTAYPCPVCYQSVTTSVWPITFSSTTGGFIAESQDAPAVHGVGRTRLEALADLRDAVREFACVTGAAKCQSCKAKGQS